MAMMHLAIRSVSHRSSIEELVTVEAGEASSVVHMLPTCHLQFIIVMMMIMIMLIMIIMIITTLSVKMSMAMRTAS